MWTEKYIVKIMKTLYESILDVDKLMDDNSAIILNSRFYPVTWNTPYEPERLLKILNIFDWKRLSKKYDSKLDINYVKSSIARHLNSKPISKKMNILINIILKEIDWPKGCDYIVSCGKSDIYYTLSYHNKSQLITFYDSYDNRMFSLYFEEK